MAILTLSSAIALAAAPQKPTESSHRAGPKGLEGWTLNYEIEGQGKLPMTLVLARRGHVIRRIRGDVFVWRWTFELDGARVAYETGPLHFSMRCVLVDVASGKQIEDYDCYSGIDEAPGWVKTLEAVGQSSFVDGDK